MRFGNTLQNNVCSLGCVVSTNCPTRSHFSSDNICFEEKFCGLEGVIKTVLAQICMCRCWVSSVAG